MLRAPAARAAATLLTVAALAVSGGASYTVRSGDTIYDLARRFGVSVTQLADANGMTDASYVRAGDVLDIPGGAGGAATGGSSSHVVKPGETLLGISITTGVLMRDIAAASGLDDRDAIYAGQSLTIPAAAVAPASASAPSSPLASASQAEVGAIIERVAVQYGFSPRFVKAVAWQESGWNNRAVSSADARGIMQVLPSTGDFVSRYVVGRPLDLRNPEDNVVAGTAYLAHLWKLTGGDPEKTLAGYYQGLRSVSKYGYFTDTRRYIDNILALRDRF